MKYRFFKYTIVFFLMLSLAGRAYPLDVSVSLFHEKQIMAALFSSHGGEYTVMEGDSLMGICPEGESWYLLKDGKRILARDHKGRWLNAGELSFLGTGENRYFGLKPVNPSVIGREYMEDLHVGQVAREVSSGIAITRICHLGIAEHLEGVPIPVQFKRPMEIAYMP